MNSWRENAKMFVGKFNVQCKIEIFAGKTLNCPIHGYNRIQGKYLVQYSGVFEWVNIDACTLIARRKDAMTIEENVKCDDEYHKDPVLGFLYLLSIGVYPFDQKAFTLPDDHEAKVIDATKLEE